MPAVEEMLDWKNKPTQIWLNKTSSFRQIFLIYECFYFLVAVKALKSEVCTIKAELAKWLYCTNEAEDEIVQTADQSLTENHNMSVD